MKRYILLVTAILSIWITSYLSSLPLNWVSQWDMSDLYPTLITPATFTFSIWSVIYLSWIILGVYVATKKVKLSGKQIWILWWAQVVSMLWLFPWHFNCIWVSLLVILTILWFLSYLISLKDTDLLFSRVAHLFFWWILVASIANAHIFLVSNNMYDHWLVLTILSILLWAGINLAILLKQDHSISSLVFIWALYGILSNSEVSSIMWVASLGVIMLWSIILLKKIKHV